MGLRNNWLILKSRSVNSEFFYRNVDAKKKRQKMYDASAQNVILPNGSHTIYQIYPEK